MAEFLTDPELDRLIHEMKLYNEVLVGRELGMRTLETSLADLVKRGEITADEARARCSRRDELERMLVT